MQGRTWATVSLIHARVSDEINTFIDIDQPNRCTYREAVKA